MAVNQTLLSNFYLPNKDRLFILSNLKVDIFDLSSWQKKLDDVENRLFY